MPVRDLRVLTTIVAAMVVIDALWAPVVLSSVAMVPGFFLNTIKPIVVELDRAEQAFKIATFIVFGSWIYVAGQNLVRADVDDLDYSPGSRIWWFAVPVANFFKPYRAMRELWNASTGAWPYDNDPPIVATWWATWLLNAVASWVVLGLRDQPGSAVTTLWLMSAAGIVRAVVAIAMIYGIARGQRRFAGEDLTHVFA